MEYYQKPNGTEVPEPFTDVKESFHLSALASKNAKKTRFLADKCLDEKRWSRWRLGLGAAALVFTTLACEPVFVVGWQELALIVALVAFLIGPLIFRAARAWFRFQDSRKDKK